MSTLLLTYNKNGILVGKIASITGHTLNARKREVVECEGTHNVEFSSGFIQYDINTIRNYYSNKPITK